jgi:hypothetical protein
MDELDDELRPLINAVVESEAARIELHERIIQRVERDLGPIVMRAMERLKDDILCEAEVVAINIVEEELERYR